MFVTFFLAIYFYAKMTIGKNNFKNSSSALNLWRLLMVLTLVIKVNARLRQNNAEVVVSCDDSAMDIKMTFKYPFSGLVFIPEHYYDSTCSYGVSPNASALQITVALPHDSCKMQILNVSNKLIGFNTIAVFHHRMLETVYDYIQNVTCELQDSINVLNKNIWHEPQLNTWISFENPISILPEDLIDKMGLEGVLLIVYHVKDWGVYQDMIVLNCIGHDDRIVNQKTNFYQISNPFGCSQESDLVSNFTVFRNPTSNQKMIAYAVIRNFSMIVQKRLYITCGVQICEEKCERNCGEADYKMGFYFSDIVTKSLVHRPDGSVRPASLTAFERFDRQRRSQDDLNLILHYIVDEQKELLFEKMSSLSPYSVIQSNGAITKLSQNGTTPLPLDSERLSNEQNESLFEKMNTLLPYSAIQSNGATTKLNQNSTTPLPLDSEEHSNEQNELLLEKINSLLPDSVIQFDGATKQFNQNCTTPLLLNSEEHSNEQDELLLEKMNSLSPYSVIQSDDATELNLIVQFNQNGTTPLLLDSDENTNKQNELVLKKVSLLPTDSVIQSDSATKQLNQNCTTPLLLDSEDHSNEQDELLFEEINSFTPSSVIQSDGATEFNLVVQLNQNCTTSLPQNFEDHSRLKRAIKQLETENFDSRLNVIVIKSEGALQQPAVKMEPVSQRITESSKYNFSNESDLASVVKIKMVFEPNHSTRIDEEQKSERFNFNSFLRALVAIFALICVSGVCYCLFSFRRNLDVEFFSGYATQPYI